MVDGLQRFVGRPLHFAEHIAGLQAEDFVRIEAGQDILH